MQFDLHDAQHFHSQVHAALRKRFRLRFLFFVCVDWLLLLLAICVTWRQTALGVFLVVALVPRLLAEPLVLFWNGEVFKLYTKIEFHRSSLLRRSALLSYCPAAMAWMWASVFAAFLICGAVILFGLLVLALSFAVGVLSGLEAAVLEIFMIALSGYFFWSERAAYNWCVTRNIDDALQSDERRRAFVMASSALIHREIEDRMRRKTAFLDSKRHKTTN